MSRCRAWYTGEPSSFSLHSFIVCVSTSILYQGMVLKIQYLPRYDFHTVSARTETWYARKYKKSTKKSQYGCHGTYCIEWLGWYLRWWQQDCLGTDTRPLYRNSVRPNKKKFSTYQLNQKYWETPYLLLCRTYGKLDLQAEHIVPGCDNIFLFAY